MTPRPECVKDSDAEIQFQAERIIFDDRHRVITAIGNVILVQGESVLRADSVRYDQNTREITAVGAVRIARPEIESLSADFLRVSDDFRTAFIENITLLLTDGSSLTGESASLSPSETLSVIQGTYTACYISGDRPPVWQIRSAKILRDPETQQFTFHKITLDMLGVPLLFLPYLSIPDHTVVKKSGLIDADAGWDDDLGAFISFLTYLDLAPHLDATLDTTLYSQTYPLLDGTSTLPNACRRGRRQKRRDL